MVFAEGNGKFSVMVPLSHIFGFCKICNKVMYGIKAEFNTNVPENTIEYALILSAGEFQLQAAGNRIHIIVS